MKFGALVALASVAVPGTAGAAALSDAIRSDMPELMALYRELHAHPELSMQEVWTPARLAPEMRKLGVDVSLSGLNKASATIVDNLGMHQKADADIVLGH